MGRILRILRIWSCCQEERGGEGQQPPMHKDCMYQLHNVIASDELGMAEACGLRRSASHVCLTARILFGR